MSLAVSFVSHVLFHIFPLKIAASCSRYTHCHSRKFEFLSYLGPDNIPLLFWSLLTY